MSGAGSYKDAAYEVGRVKKFYQSLPGGKIEPVTGPGGKVVMPKNEINTVGTVAVILDTEGKSLGLWKPLVL